VICLAFNKGQIEEAKKKLGESAAHIIASDLELESFDDKALKSCCPFHNDKTPSFVYNKKENYFKCFSCGKVYGIVDHFVSHYKMAYLEAIKTLFKRVDMNPDDVNFGSKDEDNKDYFKNYKYPKEEKGTKRDKVDTYLAKRGISKETLDYCNVKEDSKGNIVFEHRDIDSTLLCTKYRVARAVNKGKDGSGTWWQADSSTCPILYNIDKIDITKPLVICEGHIDALSIVESGYTNVVSIPHGAGNYNYLEFNYSFLELFDEINLWYDNDSAGEEGVKHCIPRIGEHRVKIIKPSKEIEDKVFDYYRQFGDFNIKKTDANNVLLACGKQTVLNLIDGAIDIPMPDVLDLMSMEEIDISKSDKIEYPYQELNKLIYGSIAGSVSLVTGRTGTGKSTFVTHANLLEPIQQGERVFVFSGEMMGGQIKNWVLSQAATRDHVIEWNNGANKPKSYSVTREAKAKIEEWMKGKVFFYNNFLDTKPTQILSRMEAVCKKYGVKSFIIDNMMTIDFSEYDDELKAQTDFMKMLIRFSLRFGVYVHIVAHPRKGNGTSADPSTDDVSGSGNIGNLTHRMMFLTKCKDQSEGDIDSIVLKDRFTGKVGKKVRLRYDEPTRRLYGSIEELNKRYDWDDGSIVYDKKTFGDKGKLLELANDNHYNEVIGQIKK